MSTASIIIIGDEILSAKFRDENTPWLIDKCRSLHIAVRTVRIIQDDLQTIADVVAEESRLSTYVFTTGGVGPTHDDLTFLGIAKAFGMVLKRNERLKSLIHNWFGEQVSSDTLRMADIPDGARLIETKPGYPPQIVVHNVYPFPGIPKLLQRKFQAIEHTLSGVQMISRQVGFSVREVNVATELRQIQEAHNHVNIGSYPRFGEDISLIVTIEGRDQALVDAAYEQIQTTIAQFEGGNKDS